MKKYKIIIVLVIVFCIITICCFIINKSNENNFTQLYSAVDEKGYGIAPSEISNIDYDRPEDNVEWKRTLSIIYPQIYGMDDFEKEQLINGVIIDSIIGSRRGGLHRSYIEYKSSYEIIKADRKILNILVIGEVHSPQKFNEIKYNIVIDLEKCEIRK